MVLTRPAVRGDSLLLRDGHKERPIGVGSAEWFAWLDQATAFSFASPCGTFSARKEHYRRGGWYWRAYCRRRGTLRHAYLGKSEALSLERLNEVAAALLAKSGGDGSTIPARGEGPRRPKQDAGRETASVSLQSPNRRSAEAQSGPLVTTKLLLPPVLPDFVARPRLIEALDEVSQRKLILVSAPAGSGKTTLLSQWRQHSSLPVASVALDAADDDPARFWTYVVAAIQGLYPNVAEPVLALLRSPNGFLADSAPEVLINALVAMPGDFVLVLDDYHTINSPAIHRAVDYLLDRLPPQVHLVIATRADPPLSLGRMRGKGQLTELRPEDLNFSLEEATTFLNQVMRLELSADDVTALGERTEGWAVGLQVAALSLRGREDRRAFIEAFAGDHRHIADYLAEEVLAGLSQPLQDFLLQTCVLERLNAELCEAVTRQKNGQAMLEDLERANLFTLPLDTARRWYRYHHLFADFLRRRLEETSPEQVTELHRRASVWYAAHGLAREAVGHAFAAKDPELAAAMVERSTGRLVLRGEMITLLSWLRALPNGLIRASPRLCISYAWALTSTADVDGAESWVAEAERGLRERGSDPRDARDHRNDKESARMASLWDEAMALRAEIAALRGNWPLAIQLGRQALERSSEISAALRSNILYFLGNAYWQVGDPVRAEETIAEAASAGETVGHIPNATMALVELGYVQERRGRLRDAAANYRRAMQLAGTPATKATWYAGWPHTALGHILYEWNDLRAARYHAQEGTELARQAGVPGALYYGYSLLASLKQTEGDIDGALALVQQTAQLARQSDLRRAIPTLKATEALLWIKRGDLERAGRWARESGVNPDDPPEYRRESEHKALAQVLLAQGETETALRLLVRLGEAAELAGRTGNLIKILALQALAFSAAATKDRALCALGRALVLAEPEGYVRTFVDHGAPLVALLSEITDQEGYGQLAEGCRPSPAYVHRLLSAFASKGRGTSSSVPFTSAQSYMSRPLSCREQEVLRLIAAGCSAWEIARELVITMNTVKTHLKNIYGKLDVHSAKEATARARDLQLL